MRMQDDSSFFKLLDAHKLHASVYKKWPNRHLIAVSSVDYYCSVAVSDPGSNATSLAIFPPAAPLPTGVSEHSKWVAI
eukprot:174-Heterococcus_DN1.PRE.2